MRGGKKEKAETVSLSIQRYFLDSFLVVLTNTDVDLAESDLVGNLVNGSETRRALSVQAVATGSVGNTGPERAHAGLGGTTTGSKDGTDGNILDELRVDLGLGKNTLKGPTEELLGSTLRETTLLGPGDGGSESRNNDDCAWQARRASSAETEERG